MVDLDVALFIAGVILLVVGIIGDVEIRGIKIGTDNPIARIILGLIGILFICVSLYIYFSPKTPSPISTEYFAPTLPSSQIVTISPSEPPSALTQVTHIPIIHKVVESEEYKAGDLYLNKDIFFSDVDGDAYSVTYELLSASIAGIEVNNDPIQSSPSEQAIGTYVTGTWDCQKIGSYTIVLKARILDRAGNQSEPVDLTFNCH
jgi:hypothetical protein